jgi:hypothetical protein
MKIIEKEFNGLTGQETITEREETAAEASTRKANEAERAAAKLESEKKAIAKAALLDRLGITADEAALLLS